MAILASALVTIPVALSADGVANLVGNIADQGPLNVPNPGPNGNSSVPSALGATGATPHNTQLSQALVHEAGNPSELSTGAGPQADLPSGPLGIPGVVLDAYEHAQQVMAVQDPGCQLPWWLLAGIGKIESNQAEHGEVDSNGTTLRPILGPTLDGQHGFAALPAINGGQWTGDPVWQHAVGPMQFLPSTWLTWGDGGNPNNVYDSALAAGRYLCSGGGNLSQPADQAAAVFSYNHSDSYVRIVLIWANAYRNGVTPLPETTVVPQGPMPVGTPVGDRTVPTTNRPAGTPGAGGATNTSHPATGGSSSSVPAGSGTPIGSGTSTTIPNVTFSQTPPPGDSQAGGGTTTTQPPTTTTTTPDCTTPTTTPTDTVTPTTTPTPDPNCPTPTTTTAPPPAAVTSDSVTPTP